MPKILAALYLLLMVAAGWRLFTISWSRTLKIAAGVAMVVPIPMLFLLPALVQPDRPFADLLRAIGIALMLGGGVSLLGGVTGAWFKARKA
ncbi:hypothetical protein A0J57_04630 [Sphingobium sp. 22B]|uniref:hypothetical protein n=1 Tax=unclassified Sphingobium TaxID=2611147 RepID=UPI0007803CB8|nr:MULTISPECIES: hypothetical protein [unclassified Sphingobium]KXU29709.1 hypothetical protein AXW74_21495 [Sphingobium sp. AM]KYC33408.1 hypothetical protein A0J57_04630 [Sphingobium sp. 22B]OAP32592.1 hypothetical protein A8O16_06750 [Sphingobium sp. 20006FA]